MEQEFTGWYYAPDLEAVVKVHDHKLKMVADLGKVEHPEKIGLILAAAPDLKEALVCCIGFISGEHSNTEIDREEVLEIARDALAKISTTPLQKGKSDGKRTVADD